MSLTTTPSTATEREARASRMTRRAGSRAIRMLIACLAIASLLAVASPAAAQELDTGADTTAQPATGDLIAEFALGYVGYPYVWAGNTPAGFDCSGFTQYVIQNTVGIDIGHSVPGQTGFGAWVDWDTWQPGDLVFFANTYREGISHVGIYIGDGQFVHAENEGTGVTISSLYSDYYSGHYYGAYRIG